jgi:hypothetical protein
MENSFLSFFTKQATLTRRSMVLSLPLQLEFPGEQEKPLLDLFHLEYVAAFTQKRFKIKNDMRF